MEASDVVREIAPLPGDTVIAKRKVSPFFGTPLVSHLTYLRVDTVLVCGMAAGGCVHAAVVGAFSYDFRMAVVEEATFDRGEPCHRVNLFEMDMKYADVVNLQKATQYLRECE